MMNIRSKHITMEGKMMKSPSFEGKSGITVQIGVTNADLKFHRITIIETYLNALNATSNGLHYQSRH